MSNYGYPGPPPQGPQYQTNAPNATTALVLGILGVVCCGILAPIAWIMGNNALGEIERSGGAYGGEGMARAGQILGIIGTILWVVGIIIRLAVLNG
jgi:hypothetical protein